MLKLTSSSLDDSCLRGMNSNRQQISFCQCVLGLLLMPSCCLAWPSLMAPPVVRLQSSPILRRKSDIFLQKPSYLPQVMNKLLVGLSSYHQKQIQPPCSVDQSAWKSSVFAISTCLGIDEAFLKELLQRCSRERGINVNLGDAQHVTKWANIKRGKDLFIGGLGGFHISETLDLFLFSSLAALDVTKRLRRLSLLDFQLLCTLCADEALDDSLIEETLERIAEFQAELRNVYIEMDPDSAPIAELLSQEEAKYQSAWNGDIVAYQDLRRFRKMTTLVEKDRPSCPSCDNTNKLAQAKNFVGILFRLADGHPWWSSKLLCNLFRQATFTFPIDISRAQPLAHNKQTFGRVEKLYSHLLEDLMNMNAEGRFDKLVEDLCNRHHVVCSQFLWLNGLEKKELQDVRSRLKGPSLAKTDKRSLKAELLGMEGAEVVRPLPLIKPGTFRELLPSPSQLQLLGYFPNAGDQSVFLLNVLESTTPEDRLYFTRTYLVKNYEYFRLSRDIARLDEIEDAATTPNAINLPPRQLFRHLDETRERREMELLKSKESPFEWLKSAHNSTLTLMNIETSENVTLRALRSPYEVALIGKQMQNCASVYVERIRTGNCMLVAMYNRSQVDDLSNLKPIALGQLDKSREQWTQIYGKMNERVSSGVRDCYLQALPFFSQWMANATTPRC